MAQVGSVWTEARARAVHKAGVAPVLGAREGPNQSGGVQKLSISLTCIFHLRSVYFLISINLDFGPLVFCAQPRLQATFDKNDWNAPMSKNRSYSIWGLVRLSEHVVSKKGSRCNLQKGLRAKTN